jgi:opacity protein-like surface antigen
VNGLGSVGVDGSLKGIAFFANVVLTYPEWTWIKPYVGGGIGLVHFFDSDVTVGGATVSTGSDTEFAFQAKAGVAFQITPTISIAPEYRFIWVNTSGNGIGNTHAHAIGASLKFSF